MQDQLPENPLDHRREGKPYLRLSNECPDEGIVMQIHGYELVENDRFGGRQEYHWSVTHYTPAPVPKVCTESSKGFCTALANLQLTMDELQQKLLHIKWTKEELGTRTIKYWDIRVIDDGQLKELFEPTLS